MVDSHRGDDARMDGSISPQTDARVYDEHQQAKGNKSLSYEQRKEILDQLFFEGERRIPHIKQFYVMLSLAAIIATFGLMRNSASVVIGAMLISPLMTPILGTSATLAMGWPVRASRLVGRLFFATVYVFSISYLILFIFKFPRTLRSPRKSWHAPNRKSLNLSSDFVQA